jgi:hypothetical protein
VTIEEHLKHDWVELRDGTRCMERYVCHCSVCESHPKGPQFADERYSLGIYAGRYCDEGWKLAGYRDEGPEGFDAGYAGERYDDDY